MNTHISVSTIPRPAGWHAIDWRACHARVRKLQLRIAEATRQQQWRRVRELQHILTRSFSGKAVAVRRVTENTGKRTPGVDGKTWGTPDEKWKGMCNLSLRGYRPLPLRRIHIPKSNGKKRPLGIPTIRDRAMQALWLLALEPVAETTADNNSYGFRPMRSTHDAIESIFNRMSQKVSPAWMLEGDIKGCFDNISHDWLLSNIQMDKRILRKWLKAGYMEKGVFFRTESGTPQGGIISPLLANMALDGLEEELMRTFMKSRHYGAKHQVNYVRYADDFICSGISRELLENEVKPLIAAFMQKRGLTLSEEKTAITHIEEGFDFLGQNVRKYGGKMLIKPAKKNLKNFLSKVRRLIKGNPTLPAWKLINLFNPVIRGWAKTYVACALGEQACQQNIQVAYYRLTRLLDDLNVGHADGSYQKQLLQLSKKELLILDDCGLEKLNTRQASDLPEVMEDRYQRGSTVIISQLPVSEWYKLVSNPTVADALMDRLLHNGHRVELKGESMRKLAQTDQTG